MRSREPEATLEKPAVSLPKLTQDEITKVELENPEKKLKVTLVKQEPPKSEPRGRRGREPPKPAANWRVAAPLDAQGGQAPRSTGWCEKLAGLEIASIAATRRRATRASASTTPRSSMSRPTTATSSARRLRR